MKRLFLKLLIINVIFLSTIVASGNIKLFLDNLEQDRLSIESKQQSNLSLVQYSIPLGFNSIQTREINRLKAEFVQAYTNAKNSPTSKLAFDTIYNEFKQYLVSLNAMPKPVTTSTSTVSTAQPSVPVAIPTTTTSSPAQPAATGQSWWRWLTGPHAQAPTEQSSASSATSTGTQTQQQEDEDRALALSLAAEEVRKKTTAQQNPTAPLTGDPDTDKALLDSLQQLILERSAESFIPTPIPDAARQQQITGQSFVNPRIINISDKVSKQLGSTCGYHSYKNLAGACALCERGDLIDIASSEPSLIAGSRDVENEQFPISNWKNIIQEYRATKNDLSNTETLTWDEIMHLVNQEGKLPNGSLFAIPNIKSFINDISDPIRIRSSLESVSNDEVNKLKIYLMQLVNTIRTIQDAITTGTRVTYGFALCNIDTTQGNFGHWRAYVVDVKDRQATIYVMDSGKGANIPPRYGNEPEVLNALVALLNQEPDILQGIINSSLEHKE